MVWEMTCGCRCYCPAAFSQFWGLEAKQSRLHHQGTTACDAQVTLLSLPLAGWAGTSRLTRVSCGPFACRSRLEACTVGPAPPSMVMARQSILSMWGKICHMMFCRHPSFRQPAGPGA